MTKVTLHCPLSPLSKTSFASVMTPERRMVQMHEVIEISSRDEFDIYARTACAS